MAHRKPKFAGNKGKTRITYPGKLDEWEPDPIQLEIFAAVEKQDRTHKQIADQYGISRGRVSQMIKRMREWKARQIMPTIEQLQRKHELLLYKVAEEAWTEWERSKKNAESLSEKTGLLGTKETTTVTKGQCGDPRYLEQVRSALADIRKIRGADAPVKTLVGGVLGVMHSGGITIQDAATALEEKYGNELEQLARNRLGVAVPGLHGAGTDGDSLSPVSGAAPRSPHGSNGNGSHQGSNGNGHSGH